MATNRLQKRPLHRQRGSEAFVRLDQVNLTQIIPATDRGTATWNATQAAEDFDFFVVGPEEEVIEGTP